MKEVYTEPDSYLKHNRIEDMWGDSGDDIQKSQYIYTGEIDLPYSHIYSLVNMR